MKKQSKDVPKEKKKKKKHKKQKHDESADLKKQLKT